MLTIFSEYLESNLNTTLLLEENRVIKFEALHVEENKVTTIYTVLLYNEPLTSYYKMFEIVVSNKSQKKFFNRA